jgi:hypothetical protein
MYVYVCIYIYIYIYIYTYIRFIIVHTDRNEIRKFLSKTQVKWNRQNDSRKNGWLMGEE